MESWLSCGSFFRDTDPSSTLLNAVGLLLLLLLGCYLLLKPSLPAFWARKDPPKLRRRSKRRRSTTLKGWRASLREKAEGRKLLSILQSHLRQHPDINYFRWLLCPDPLCDVCNTTAAKVSRVLSRASQEDTVYSESSSISTDSDSSWCTQYYAKSAVPPRHPVPAPVRQPSPQPFVLPPNPVPASVASLSSVPLGDSQQEEPIPPLDSIPQSDCFLPKPLASPHSPQHHTQGAKPSLQPESTWAACESPGVFSANNFDRVTSNFHGDTEAFLFAPGKLGFLSPESRTLPERQVKKRSDLLMGSGKEKRREAFPKQHQPDSPRDFSWERSESAADQKDSVHPFLVWSSAGQPEGLHMLHRRHPSHKNSDDNLGPKRSQFFWGLPSLHSESLKPIVSASGNCSSVCIQFNTICGTSTAHESPVLLHPPPLSLPEAQTQPLLQDTPHPQCPCLLPVQTQAQPRFPPPTLPASPLCQPRSCGVCFHSTQGEARSPTPAEIQELVENVLQKVQESVWGLPSVVRRSQEDFCPPAPKLSLSSRASKAPVPVSILPGDVPCSSELRKKVEHHLRKRPIQHLPSPEKPPSQVKDTDAAPSAGESNYLNTAQELSFLASSKREMWEEHSRTFHKRMTWGLPHKVRESIEFSSIKEGQYPALPHSKIPSSDNCVSDPGSKTGVCRILRRRPNDSRAKACVTQLLGQEMPSSSKGSMPSDSGKKRTWWRGCGAGCTPAQQEELPGPRRDNNRKNSWEHVFPSPVPAGTAPS